MMGDSGDQVPPPPYSAYDPHGQPQRSAGPISPSLTFPKNEKRPIVDDETSNLGSGAAYFSTRPSSASRVSPILTYHVPLLRMTNAECVRFPMNEKVMQERDIGKDDWQVFLYHLGLQQPEESPASTSRDPYAILREICTESQVDRSSRIKAIVVEWLNGFYAPRGLEILMKIGPNPEACFQNSGEAQSYSSSVRQTEQSLSDQSTGQALYEAVSKGNASIVQKLLDYGANVNTRPTCAKPALTRAIERNDWHIAQMILERGRPDLETTAPAGPTALYAAVSRGSEKIVELLLKNGADVTAKPSGGEPMMYNAVSRGFNPIVRILLDTGSVKINGTPPGGSPAVYRAYEKGNMPMMDLLLARNANPDCKPPGGITMLHKATGKGDLQTTRRLLEYGADPDFTPPGGRTALYHAVKKGQDAIARLLLDYGADVRARPSYGDSALWVAADKSNLSLCQFLLEHGADVECAAQKTALWHAAKRNDVSVARLLLEHGADPDKTTMGGETALMIAESKCNVAMAGMLAAYGADPHKQKSGLKSPVVRAAKASHIEVLTAMLDAECARLK